QATDFRKLDLGVSLYLYRLGMSSRRNLPPRTGPSGLKLRPAFPIDLYYLLTAWAQTPEMQQRLLGWAIRTIEDSSVIPAGVLNHYLSDGYFSRTDECFDLVLEPLPLTDLTNIGEV